MTLPRAPQRMTPAFGFSFIERAIRECLTDRKFGRTEMEQIVQFFYGTRDPECVYCGSVDVRRWDHLVPVAQGGDTVIGNMVLACARCDDSKQASDFEQWMNGGAPQSPRNRGVTDVEQRVQHIREYVEHHCYEARPVEERLDVRERDELAAIRRQMKDGRARLEQLITDHRARL